MTRLEYVVRLPLPPRELHPNSRVNWKAKHGKRSKYRHDCGFDVLAQCPERPRLQAADLWAFFVFARGRNGQVQAQDADNLIAWLKAPIDSLVDGGLLEDDRWVTYRPPIQVCSLSAKSELVLVLRPS